MGTLENRAVTYQKFDKIVRLFSIKTFLHQIQQEKGNLRTYYGN